MYVWTIVLKARRGDVPHPAERLRRPAEGAGAGELGAAEGPAADEEGHGLPAAGHQAR